MFLKIAKYENFIKENVSPLGAKRIAVYKDGKKMSIITLNSLSPKANQADKLYSFGALSDVHINQYSTAASDFIEALRYFNNDEKVAFVCIAGDLAANGMNQSLGVYKSYVDQYSQGLPIYAITGNHETWRDEETEGQLRDVIEQYTGKPLYYAFEHGNDVFIMLGMCGKYEGTMFPVDALQWLYETLEANRNKRCFLFEHIFADESSGNAYGIYNLDLWEGRDKAVLDQLLSHYKNVITFHGHSHLKFDLQDKTNKANIDKDKYGTWQVHIPSIAAPRTGTPYGANSAVTVEEGSEGYVVDVYENGIHLRGRDFVKGDFLPIASYWLDTTLTNIEAGGFTDSTGTIKTQ